MDTDNGILLEDYFRYLKIERAMSPNTAAAYRSDVAFFLDSAGISACDVTPEDIEAYLSAKISGIIISANIGFFFQL